MAGLSQRGTQRFAGHHPDREGARIIAEIAAKQAGYDPATGSDESYQELTTLPGLGDAHGWRYEAEFQK